MSDQGIQVTPGMVFKPNPDFLSELNDEPGVRATRNAYAETAAVHARAIGEAIRDTGAYARSIRAEGNTVLSDDPGAAYIEFGSVHNPPFAPLRRAVDATGATLTDRGADPNADTVWSGG